MKGTSRFIVFRHKSPNKHYDLVLENNGEARHWIVPKKIPGRFREKRIAIEERGPADFRLNGGHLHAAEDNWGSGPLEIWDEGVFETEAANSIKLVIKASGERFKGRYLLLVPGWGRWTGKKLWVIEKIREE